MPDPLREVLHRLDEWRHLPKYRLEQHVDVLFGMTLPRVLSSRFGIPRRELHVIPEFPIRYGTLKQDSGKAGENQSFNVDFSVWHKESGRVFLVELKTDMGSIDSEQLCNMVKVRHRPLGDFIDGVRCIANAPSPQPRKYAQLIWRLHEVGAMCVPPRFKTLCMEERTPGLTGETGVFNCCRASATYQETKPKLVLVTPTPPTDRDNVPCEFECIDFCQYAHIIHGAGDLEDTFAYYLLRWQREAGVTNPWLGTGP